MWSEKRELVKHASELAKKKHPSGFNKDQLISCSKEVFGGFATDKLKAIKTMEDISHRLNEMALIDGNYPLGMTGCEVVGVNGNCGTTCPVFQAGDCENIEEFNRQDVIDELGQEEAEEILSLY